MRLRSFPPLGAPQATRLILGTMPGAASLAATRYYAHPRNAFWHIAGNLLGFAADAPYAERVRILESAGIALWDVLASCVRPSSLDSDIDTASAVANDLRGFLRRHPLIGDIYCNGAHARRLYEKLVLPALTAKQQQIALHTLPSTSPANARFNLQQKQRAWAPVFKPRPLPAVLSR